MNPELVRYVYFKVCYVFEIFDILLFQSFLISLSQLRPVSFVFDHKPAVAVMTSFGSLALFLVIFDIAIVTYSNDHYPINVAKSMVMIIGVI